MQTYTTIYGNAISIADNNPAMYGKNITLRYPITSGVSGSKVKLTLDNFTGYEPVTINKVTVAIAENDLDFLEGTCQTVTFNGSREVTIDPYANVVSDEIDLLVKKGQRIMVSMYLKDHTLLRSGVLITGPLSTGVFATNDQCDIAKIDHKTYKPTNWFYFLSQVDVLTEDNSKCILCYGDSITAQHWPDVLQKHFLSDDSNTTIIRRAVSGARILRQYQTLQYESYGLSAFNRASHEITGENVDTVIILQGINDLIHPVGVETNEFRPWSDLPTVEQLIDGIRYLINIAKSKDYKVIVGTILPVEGWRTYQPFRDAMRQAVNDWIRTTDEVDGVIDFDLATRDPENPKKLVKEYNSGDNLHPSSKGYEVMGKFAYDYLKNNNY